MIFEFYDLTEEEKKQVYAIKEKYPEECSVRDVVAGFDGSTVLQLAIDFTTNNKELIQCAGMVIAAFITSGGAIIAARTTAKATVKAANITAEATREAARMTVEVTQTAASDKKRENEAKKKERSVGVIMDNGDKDSIQDLDALNCLLKSLGYEIIIF